MKKLLLALLTTVYASNAYSATRCIFGDEIGDLEENHRLTVKSDVIKTFKLSRIEPHGELIMVSVSIITDKKTHRVFHMNATFRHKDDGDNTIGWIEEVTGAADHDDGVENEGRVVVKIADSGFDECKFRE